MNPVYLGIDVSKRHLHLATPKKFLKKFDNTVDGHQLLIKHVEQLDPTRVVLEASGGYEKNVCEALQQADISVTLAQPASVRYFAKSLKVLAKTDEIDACVIARFGEATQPAATPKTPENTRQLRILSDRRQQIVEDRVRETGRLETCADPAMAAVIQTSINHLQTIEQNLDQQIETLIKNDDQFHAKAEVMLAQKGIGQKTVNVLLAHFSELGSLNRNQVAALAGLAPHTQESGGWNGKRRIFGGRAAVRKAIYMAAKSAARWCPVISPFFQNLRQRGKAYNVALIACARKMLIHLNTLLQRMNSTHSAASAQINTIST